MIKGQLEAYYETGTEGIIWSLVEPDKDYEGLHCLKNGDYLIVYEKDSEKVRWEGIIDLEYIRRQRPLPFNPQYSQQEIFGRWVHGFQSNLEPDVWAYMFFEGCNARLKLKQ